MLMVYNRFTILILELPKGKRKPRTEQQVRKSFSYLERLMMYQSLNLMARPSFRSICWMVAAFKERRPNGVKFGKYFRLVPDKDRTYLR